MDHAKVFASLAKALAYSPDPFRQECSALFEHVFESYPKRNARVCTSGMSIRTLLARRPFATAGFMLRIKPLRLAGGCGVAWFTRRGFRVFGHST